MKKTHLRCERKDITNEPHAWLRWVDKRVADHELLEDIILDGSREFFEVGTLLKPGDDIHGENWQHSTVHGHGNGHLIERNAVKQNLHVFNRVDSYSSHANVAHHTRVVRVVPVGMHADDDGASLPSMCGQIECHRETLLPGLQVLAIETIGFLNGAEAGVL
ncbi:hypothetical protein BC937DRAFT_94354 [Endogone sp. FLAS-F59071]|nr:hypothetical protein BC937DRAFT_94354 [Endogone sp. FLAS-F59071]|eukprot:RUS20806.1 hypothetical protein BC937DRAFT_94354 [Endogone sp. FLAS-F59071]